MSQILVGTQKALFSHDRFPITPDTMGDFSVFPKEMLLEMFNHLGNNDLANVAIVNWTCKEVVERSTDWGERKRFFRFLPFLFNHVSSLGKPEFYGWADQEVEKQLINLHSNIAIGRKIHTNNVLMMTYFSSWCDFAGPATTFFYELNLQKNTRRREEYCYQMDNKKLQKIPFDNPTHIVNELDLSEKTQSAKIVGFSGNRLLVWLQQLDLNDTDNPATNFCTLQAINKETFQIETSHDFYSFPDTPLPKYSTHFYLDHKLCIVTSQSSCAIKMGKSPLRIDQEILRPLLEMQINCFSLQNRPDGQMEVSLEGVRDGKNICMHHTVDPFDPLDKTQVFNSVFFRSCQIEKT